MYRRVLTAAAIVCAAFVPWLLMAAPAAAVVIAQDDFESYALGTIQDQGTAGNGWTSAWTGLACTKPASVALRDVSSGVLPGFGQSLELGFSAVQSSGAPTNNNVLQRTFDPKEETVYVGFAFKTIGFENGGTGVTAGDMFQVYVNNTTNDSGTAGSQGDSLSCGVDFSPPPEGDNGAYFARKGGDQTPTVFIHSNDAIHRIVMRVSRSGATIEGYFDEVAVFVDQVTEGIPDAARGAGETVEPTFSTVSVLHMRIWGMELEDRILLDGLRIATTYAEALPEIPVVPDVPGDADGNGVVNHLDAARLAAHWLQDVTPGDVGSGDFNNDGRVDDLDASILAANWQYSGGGGAAAVPEPSAVVLLLLAGACGLALRRRTRPAFNRIG